MASPLQLPNLLDGKGEDSRLRIASQVGDRLCAEDLPTAERLAAEALARSLVGDAIERVRRALSLAIRNAKHLPRQIALRIAHDVDSVSCPFLEVTEVFSDSDWRQLVLTISRGARIAAARRTSMSEGLALALSEVGDTVVAETLVENPAAPMTAAVCHSLIDRFAESTWVLDKLAERDGIGPEIAVKLCTKVSASARRKLARVYQLPEYTDPIGVAAERDTLIQLIREASESRLISIALTLKSEGRLDHALLLRALREGQLGFFAAALTVLTSVRYELVRVTVQRGGVTPMTQLLRQANIAAPLHDDFWNALQTARGEAERSEPALS
jgi:uncharacterized protein (DUF2336 family)